jgi:hypothetical protein
MSTPITVSYEDIVRCTLQFEDEAQFEEWQDQGSVLSDLHYSQILFEEHHMEVSQDD